jgi:hypothetical protein
MGSMTRFTKKYKYDEKMDGPQIRELCDAMNALPGIETFESCSGHGSAPLRIWFKVSDDKGLFFLTRCVDHRYWKYGYLWKIELYVGDLYKSGGQLPITYCLNSGPIVGEDALVQARHLVNNMNIHLNTSAFLDGYELDISDFDL